MLQFIVFAAVLFWQSNKKKLTKKQQQQHKADTNDCCESAFAAILGPFSMWNKYNHKMNRIERNTNLSKFLSLQIRELLLNKRTKMIVLIIANSKVIVRIIVIWKLACIFCISSHFFSFDSSNASLNWKLNQRFNLMAINHKNKLIILWWNGSLFCQW